MLKNNYTWLILILLLLTSGTQTRAQQVERIEPASWWIGFANPTVQVLVYGENIASLRPSVSYPGVHLERIVAVENPNYLFLDLIIEPEALAGKVEVLFFEGRKERSSATLELLEREEGSASREGFNQSDAIYLIMPDRFANANPDNDKIDGMLENPDRSEP